MIVGISGKARSGKDRTSEVFIKHGFTRISFADELKRMLSDVFCLPLETFYDDNLKDSPFETPVVITNTHLVLIESHITTFTSNNADSLYDHAGVEVKSPREMMQYVGTEVCRKVDDELWLKAFKHRTKGFDNVVCPDVRLPNERNLIRELNGFLFWIDRPGLVTNVPQHVSETSYGPISEYDVVINNNGTLDNLKHSVNAYLRYIFPKKVFYAL